MEYFKELISNIKEAHLHLQSSATKSVNQALTIRNWLIGFYIVEFEQGGQDRSDYGSSLLEGIAKQIDIKGLSAPELSRCRQFYHCYPQILGTLSQELKTLIPISAVNALSSKNPPQNTSLNTPQTPVSKIITKLSFSHLSELIKIDSPLKRTFYELECIKGTWSVRELKRQINSQYFERSGLSQKPEQLSQKIQNTSQAQEPQDIIKNIYAFDFLGLSSQSIIEESDLETGLLDHLQQFILELGNGFCFEARQKRILIGENYYFIDLLFYHRILKCHVLIELKLGAFEHGDIGQLNTYLNYFKAEISEPSDNPPVGILLVAEKDHALVEYATAGMDPNLFVQQYMLQLPNPEHLQAYIEKELKILK